MSAPASYRPDNMLGNICSVIADRTGKSPETVAHLIAERFGNDDYDKAEDRIWDLIGPQIDKIQHHLGLEDAE